MIRALLIVLMMLAAGCRDRRDPDAIDLDVALKNTEGGEYSLIAVSDADGARFVSFQKSADHKRQYYFEAADRTAVLRRVADSVQKARELGHSLGTMGGEEILGE